MLDLNVLLDVIQKRPPHFVSSAEVLDRVARGEIKGCVPAHAITTIHYIVARYAGRGKADQAIDWILARTRVVPAAGEQFMRARWLAVPDFEDAVVAVLADVAHCDCVVSRNIAHFAGSPVPAFTPEEFLLRARQA